MVLDTQGLLADDQLGELLDGDPDGFRAPFAGGLAPPNDAALGLDADEEPSWGHEEGLDA